jgi:predicted nucleotidyltransferase component of viral defense system
MYYNADMRAYSEKHIRKAEIAQLILLYHLYSQPGSRDLIFQGGTALRWCYGGSRFSEDLDFVTRLPADALRSLVAKTIKGVEREIVPHFGPGRLELAEKAGRAESLKLLVIYRPLTAREKISVRLEFEGLGKGFSPATANSVLSSLPSVAYLIGTGDFRIPRPSAVLVVETKEEILSDKVRALLERRYLKGRDIFDVWYLRTMLKVAAEPELIERKLRMYAALFRPARGLDFFSDPSAVARADLIAAVERDLSRFLPPDVLDIHRQDGFRELLEAVRHLALELRNKGVALP